MDPNAMRKLVEVYSKALLHRKLQKGTNRRRKMSGYLKKKHLGYFAVDYQQLRERPNHGRFFKLLRLYPNEFDYLVELLGSRLEPESRNVCMKTTEKLFLTLWYLASGQPVTALSNTMKWSASTIRSVIKETCEALYDVLQPLYLPLPTEQRFKDVAAGFWQQYQLPNAIGALDGKHVAIVKPKNSGSLYYNYKGFCSVVLLAACDAECRFTMVDAGAYGSQSDGGILRNSHFGRRLFRGALPVPPPTRLPETAGDEQPTPTMNHFFIGDAAFPLSDHIMRPFATERAGHEAHFNYRLSRARIQIERAFGLLTGSWRVLRTTIGFGPETVTTIILACVALHNYLRYLAPQELDVSPEAHGLREMDAEIELQSQGEVAFNLNEGRLKLSDYLYRNRVAHLNTNN